MWPGVAAALLLFAYALATPVRMLGHEVVTVPIDAHMTTVTAWFRGSGRFAWPLYYLVMALAIAEIARRWPTAAVAWLLVCALALQVKDTRPLRAFVRRERLRLPLSAARGSGLARHSAAPSGRCVSCRPLSRTASPVSDHHQYSDYEIKFGVVAAQEHMEFEEAGKPRAD